MASSSSFSRQLTSTMSRWVQVFSGAGRDSLSLSRAIWNAHRGSSTTIYNNNSNTGSNRFASILKPVLLEQARQSNRVATSLLYMEKEYGLVQYFGWRRYLQQRFRTTTTKASPSSLMATSSSEIVPSHDDNTVTTTTTNDEPSKKKIAFMITSSMKQELQDEPLGFSAEQIKKMTPLQASLTLSHQVTSEKYDETIGALEGDYQKEQEQLRQKEEELLRAEQEQQVQEEVQQQQKENDEINPVALRNSDRNEPEQQQQQPYVFEDISSSLSPAQLASAIGVGSGFKETWYEVREIKPNGESIRQGLHPDMAEAELGLETRETIRDRQMEKDQHRYGIKDNQKEYSTFEIREITRTEIMNEH